MARHNARAASAQPQVQVAARSQVIPGGAAGVPTVDEGPRFQPQVVRGPEVRAQRYMVVDGPRDGTGRIRYMDRGSYLTSLSPGKEVTGNTHDLGHLRGQGIKLELIPDIIEEEEVPPTVTEVPAEVTEVPEEVES